MTTEQNQNFLSFAPGDFAVGGGALDDVRATIVKSEVVTFDYNGNTDDGEPRTCWAITYRLADAQDDEDMSIDYLQLGKMDQFTPSPDGKRAVAVGSKVKIHKNSKPAMYVRSLIDKGFPANGLAQDVSVITGLDVHLNTIAMPAFKNKSGEAKEGKVTLVTKIYTKGDGAAAKPATTTKPASSKPAAGVGTVKPAAAVAAPAAVASGDIDEATDALASEFIFNQISEGGGKIAKASLPGKAFKAFSDATQRNAVVRAINNAGWIGGEGRPWKLASGELTVE